MAMSELSDILDGVQQNIPPAQRYGLYTDRGFTRLPPLIDHPYPPNDYAGFVKNFRMRAARITVEWSYGLLSNLFKACRNFEHWVLLKARPYAREQLRVSFLLINCYVCVHGSQASSFRKFGAQPPLLEDYLN